MAFSWRSEIDRFALLHWEDVKITVLPSEDEGNDEDEKKRSEEAGEHSKLFKLKILRTSAPGLALLVTDLIQVYFFSATGSQLQQEKEEHFGVRMKIEDKDLIGLLCDMLRPHQRNQATIRAVQTKDCLELRAAKSISEGHLDLKWTFHCRACGSPEDQAVIIRDQILLPLQDMVNQLYFRSHQQAHQLREAQANLPVRSIHHDAPRSSRSPPPRPITASLADSVHSLDPADVSASVSAAALLETPDSQQQFQVFTSSDEFRENVGAHYRSVMNHRSQSLHASDQYDRLKEEFTHHLRTESDVLGLDYQSILPPFKKPQPALRGREEEDEWAPTPGAGMGLDDDGNDDDDDEKSPDHKKVLEKKPSADSLLAQQRPPKKRKLDASPPEQRNESSAGSAKQELMADHEFKESAVELARRQELERRLQRESRAKKRKRRKKAFV